MLKFKSTKGEETNWVPIASRYWLATIVSLNSYHSSWKQALFKNKETRFKLTILAGVSALVDAGVKGLIQACLALNLIFFLGHHVMKNEKSIGLKKCFG